MSFRRWMSSFVVATLITTSLVVTGAATPAAAAVLPTGFREQTVLTGLDQPMNVEFAPDGRIFVAEKSGRIKVFDSIADTTPTLFADLSINVHNQHDRGLLGLALHPEFPTKPYVYVLYTYDAPPGQVAPVWNDNCSAVGGSNGGRCIVTGRLSRLQAAGDVMTGTEQVLLHDWCQQYPSHSVGDLHFGADGMLYVSAGDGASYGATDYGQLGSPINPCADPPGGTMAPPTAEGGALRSQDVRVARREDAWESLAAIVTRSASEPAPIFRITLPRCAFTVISLIPSWLPACLFNRPETISAITSCSRRLNEA